MFFFKVRQYQNIETLQQFGNHFQIIGDIGCIVGTVLSMPRFKKSKYMALACLAKTELIPVLMNVEHNLGEELLHVATDVDLSSQVTSNLIHVFSFTPYQLNFLTLGQRGIQSDDVKEYRTH